MGICEAVGAQHNSITPKKTQISVLSACLQASQGSDRQWGKEKKKTQVNKARAMSSQRQRAAKYFLCLIKFTLTCRVFSQGSKPAVHKLQFTIKRTKQQPPLNLISFKLTSSRSAPWLRVHILCYNYASDSRSTIVTHSFRRGPNVTAHQGEERGERQRVPIQPIPALCPPPPAPLTLDQLRGCG